MTSLMVSMMAFVAGVKDRFSSEKGATATEYSLLVGLIALVMVAGVASSAATLRPSSAASASRSAAGNPLRE